MSFRCEDCHEVQPPGTRRYTVVVETREKVYPYRRAANLVKVNREVFTRDDRGGKGYETVREVRVCGRCASEHSHNHGE